MSSHVPCVINNTPYENLKEGLRQEGLLVEPEHPNSRGPYRASVRRQIRENLKLGNAVQVGDGPLILPCPKVTVLL